MDAMNGRKDNLVQIGGLWKQTSKGGTSYLSGKLDTRALEALRSAQAGDRLLIFKNTRKQGERDPDYSVKLSPVNDNAAKASKPASAKTGVFVNPHGLEVSDADLPF